MTDDQPIIRATRGLKRRKFATIAGLGAIVPLLTVRRAGAADQGFAVALGIIKSDKVDRAREICKSLNSPSSSEAGLQKAALAKLEVKSVKWLVVNADPSRIHTPSALQGRFSLVALVVSGEPNPLKVTGPFRSDASDSAKKFRALLDEVLDTKIEDQGCPLMLSI